MTRYFNLDGVGPAVALTCEVVELGQSLHDDGDEGQVELGHVAAHLGVDVAEFGVVAAQKGVDRADGFLVQEKHPEGTGAASTPGG